MEYPVDMELYLPREEFPQSYRSKIEIATEMIDRHTQQLSFRYVIFDSWYANRHLHEFLKSRDKNWVARLKSLKDYVRLLNSLEREEFQ